MKGIFIRWFVWICLAAVLSGCIRLGASAYYQGKDDPEPKGGSLVLDTQKMIPGQTPGSIEGAES